MRCVTQAIHDGKEPDSSHSFGERIRKKMYKRVKVFLQSRRQPVTEENFIECRRRYSVIVVLIDEMMIEMCCSQLH